MKTIACAGSKGGVGKTTIAMAITVELAKGHTVYVADLDPQKSLAELCEHRARHASDDRIVLLENVDLISSTIASLKSAGYERDYLVVDTPGAFMNVMRDAIAAADCIVLPLLPSPLDLWSQEDALKEVDKLGKRHRSLFVLNKVDGRSTIAAQTLKKLEPMAAHRPVQLTNRVDYARACIAAKSGAEINREASVEIINLVQAIEFVIRKADNDQAGHADRRAENAA